jgi:hypothetical protein
MPAAPSCIEGPVKLHNLQEALCYHVHGLNNSLAVLPACASRCAAVQPQVPDFAALCCAAAQVQLYDLQEALRSFTRALTAAVAFLDSRQAGILAQLDRQAKELLKRVQVRCTSLCTRVCRLALMVIAFV